MNCYPSGPPFEPELVEDDSSELDDGAGASRLWAPPSLTASGISKVALTLSSIVPLARGP